jgi:hypothetical protein
MERPNFTAGRVFFDILQEECSLIYLPVISACSWIYKEFFESPPQARRVSICYIHDEKIIYILGTDF